MRGIPLLTKLVLVVTAAVTLSGCVVYPARPYHAGPGYYAAAPAGYYGPRRYWR